MKVCLLTPEFLPTWGGIGTYAYNLAMGLRDRAEVHVVTTARGGVAANARSLDGIQVHVIHPDGASKAGLGLSFQLAAFRHLPRLDRIHSFDVVHANHAYMSDLLARLRRLSGARAVTVHTTLGTQVEGTLRAGGRAPRDAREKTIARWRPVFRKVEGRYLRNTAAMIFVSQWVRNHAVSRYRLAPRVSAIIPNGISMEPFARLPPGHDADRNRDDGQTLLFAGRLLALKGIETLLRAMTRLDRTIRLLLAGPGDPAAWRGMADAIGLDRERCRFLGSVPYGAMPALYHRADAVVLPSFSESCPMVALEAMASGTPLIAAAAGGVREIVTDGESGWLFPPGDVDGLVDRVETVLSDAGRAREVAARARGWVEENATVERMADRTLRLFEEACGGAAS